MVDCNISHSPPLSDHAHKRQESYLPKPLSLQPSPLETLESTAAISPPSSQIPKILLLLSVPIRRQTHTIQPFCFFIESRRMQVTSADLFSVGGSLQRSFPLLYRGIEDRNS